MKRRLRFRLIVPSFPSFNIYSAIAEITTALGPVVVATSANKLALWDVEIIDENNCRSKFCPHTPEGYPDYEALQKIRPADVIGLYGSLSSTIPRLFEIAAICKKMNLLTVAGGKHVANLPGESLENNVDIVVFGDGEETIKDLLTAYEHKRSFKEVKSICFLDEGKIHTTPERPLIDDFTAYPFPDFNLLLYAKMKIYPINRVRGCNSNCEFCAVKDRTRCSNPHHMMAQIAYLVETRGAKEFFEASDHFSANKDEAIEFCNLLAAYQEKIGKRLKINIQTRITDARYPELLKAMKRANIDTICIGYESPIDEELLAMRKGYLSEQMIRWTDIFHKEGFFIHGMFIFGYPKKDGDHSRLSLPERYRHFKNFIKKARIDTIQVLLTVPLPGTDLRKRLEEAGRIYPLDKLGWEYYDGQFPLYEPDDDIPPEELQKAVGKLMSRFYNFNNFINVIITLLFHFPRIVFISTFSLITLKVRYISRAFRNWYRHYFRNSIMRFGGFLIVKGWFKNFHKSNFLEKLEKAKKEIKESRNSDDKGSLPRSQKTRARH